MAQNTFAAAVSGSSSIAASDLVFPVCYHSCFTSQDNSLPLIKKATRRNGKPAFILSSEELKIMAEPLKHTLICKFSARMPSFDFIKKHFESLRLRGPWRLGFLDYRHIMIKLELELDYTFLFTKKLHRIESVLVKFLKWTADFDFSSEPPVAPVWIRFPGLKLHLFHKQFLFSLATVFGKPLKLDLPTFNLSRPSAARVLVEMDITLSYANEIWIGSHDEGHWQEVVIDSMPLYCTSCRLFGHCLENCYITKPHLRPEKPYRDNHIELNAMRKSPEGLENVTAVKERTLPNSVVEELHLANNGNQLANGLVMTGKDSRQYATNDNSIIHAPGLVTCMDSEFPVTCNSGPVTVLESEFPALAQNSIPVTDFDCTVTDSMKPVFSIADFNSLETNTAVFDHQQHMGFQANSAAAAVVLPTVLGKGISNTAAVFSAEPTTNTGPVPGTSTNGGCVALGCVANMETILTVDESAAVDGSQANNFNSPGIQTAAVNATILQERAKAVNVKSIVDGSAETTALRNVPSTVLNCPPVPKFSEDSSKVNQQMKELDANLKNHGAVFSAVLGKDFCTSYLAAATGVSAISAASPSTSTMRAPVYNMRPTFHSDLNSEQGNTDSDSYETYTGSHIEEDLQLNDACKEVLEEWQADWEYQKSKKKQKGFRELKGLRLNMGNSRKGLGSRRSLSGHL